MTKSARGAVRAHALAARGPSLQRASLVSAKALISDRCADIPHALTKTGSCVCVRATGAFGGIYVEEGGERGE